MRAQAAPFPRTLGEVASTLALPGGQTKLGMFASNAASGALLSDKKTAGGVAADAGISGALGTAASGIMRGVGAAIAPKLNAGLTALRDANIPVSIGQALGGWAKTAEDKMTSIPLIGDMVNAARDRGTMGFNASILNKALAPIGKALPDGMQAGHDAIKYTGDALSDGYNALVPHLSAPIDNQFLNSNTDTLKSIGTLPDARQSQFQAIINDALGNRSPGDSFNGQALKDAESKLTGLASRYGKSTDVDQSIMGDAIGNVRDNLRDLVMRSNPDHAPQLQALNQGWATLVQAEKAGGSGAARTTGIFTPKQFSAAVAATDDSTRGRAIARGTARNQSLADTAANILPSTVPDSGTTGRAMWGMGATALAGGGLGALAHPGLAAGMGVMALPYTRAGQWATNAMLQPRGPLAQAVGRGVEALAPAAGLLAGRGIPPLLQRPQ